MSGEDPRCLTCDEHKPGYPVNFIQLDTPIIESPSDPVAVI